MEGDDSPRHVAQQREDVDRIAVAGAAEGDERCGERPRELRQALQRRSASGDGDGAVLGGGLHGVVPADLMEGRCPWSVPRLSWKVVGGRGRSIEGGPSVEGRGRCASRGSRMASQPEGIRRNQKGSEGLRRGQEEPKVLRRPPKGSEGPQKCSEGAPKGLRRAFEGLGRTRKGSEGLRRAEKGSEGLRRGSEGAFTR